MVHMSPSQQGSLNLGYDLAVFAVADGHNGSAAAEHCQELLYTLLLQHLPSKPLPHADSTGNKVSMSRLSVSKQTHASYTTLQMCMALMSQPCLQCSVTSRLPTLPTMFAQMNDVAAAAD